LMSLSAAMARDRYFETARQKAADLVAAGYLLDEDEPAAIQGVDAELLENFH
jgi:hypothetical protein